jgi:predicted unusual protein kinase regulating ubiquinone biosynthesis (AarF/ABC1/UbiB family)
MTALPENPLLRAAKLAALPTTFALRQAAGLTKRVLGTSAEDVAVELQIKTAEQLFSILGELKGGALKMGQALSIFEAALPEEIAEPYRATLNQLQDSAPPMPEAVMRAALVRGIGVDWESKFIHFNLQPAHAASIGQVHRAVWHDGRRVAVKVQYPGAAKALNADIAQASRFAKMMSLIAPGMDIDPILDELKNRMVEELDYEREARSQQRFAEAFANDPDVQIPNVVFSSPSVLVTEWLESVSLTSKINHGTAEERNRIGLQYERFLLSAPSRCGLLHADPHPGNFRVTPDNKLGVLDFGAVAELPDGLPHAMGRLLRISMNNNAQEVVDGLRREGFILPGIDVDAQQLHDYLAPFTEPAESEYFSFSRDWMREQFARINDPRKPEFTIGFKINLPPSYLLIHRVWLGSIGVLSQLECTIPARAEIERWVPGFADVSAELSNAVSAEATALG